MSSRPLPIWIALCILTIGLSECKHVRTETDPIMEKGIAMSGQKRVIDPLSAIGLAVSVGATIQGAICTFSDVCSSEDLGSQIDQLEVKIDAMQKDIDDIKKDVKQVLINTEVKWYLDQIVFINQERKAVMKIIKEKDTSQAAQDKIDRFCAQVLGAVGQDQTVNKALMFIPRLITKQNIVDTYSEMVGSADGYKETWKMIKKLFRLQEHGYTSTILALGIRYKGDTKSYKTEMAELCTKWNKARSKKFEKLCSQLDKNPLYKNRRKEQVDFLLGMPNTWRYMESAPSWKSYLPALPVLLKQKDCSQFRDASGLHFAGKKLFVAQRKNENILIVKPKTLEIIKTIKLPGSECGGNCHPLDLSVNEKDMILAVAAKDQPTGDGKSYVLFFKIIGDLKKARSIKLEYYHKLNIDASSNIDIRSLAFCGSRFGYADRNEGVVTHWELKKDGSNIIPDGTTKSNWFMDRYQGNIKVSTINYMECSNSGDSWVIEKTSDGVSYGMNDGVGVVPADSDVTITENMNEIVSEKVSYDDINIEGKYNAIFHIPRMEILTGVAMDKKRNLFFATDQSYRNSINGIYKRTSDDKMHVIREWNRRKMDESYDNIRYPMRVGDIAADNNDYLYVLQKDGDKDQCLYKYDHEMNFEDIEVDELQVESE